MTEEQIQDAINQGIMRGVSGVANAMRSGASTVNVRPAKQHNPLAVAAMVCGMVVPAFGGIGWIMALQARLAVVESKQASLDSAAISIAALKQELTDFRGEFREWKRDNASRAAARDQQVQVAK